MNPSNSLIPGLPFARRPMRTLLRTTLLSAVLLAAGMAQQALALAEDRNKPMNIEAAHTEAINSGEGETRLYGGVLITQGTLRIEAEEAIVYGRLGRDTRRVLFKGEPAKLRQELDGEPGEFKARASVIEFDRMNNKVTFTDDVVINQYRGELRAKEAVYNLENGRFDAGSGRTSGESNGRVMIRIEPDSQGADTDPAGDDS